MKYSISFDLDNTLYDHAQYVYGAYRDISSAVEDNFGIPSKDFFGFIYPAWERATSRCKHIFSDALKYFDIYSVEYELYLVKIYRNHVPELRLYKGIMEGLTRLRKKGFKTGLLTDGQSFVQRKKIRSLNLEDCFDVTIITGDYGQSFYKPHPYGFQKLAHQLGVETSTIIYIGDNPYTDFKTPKNLGMTTVRILSGEYKYHQHEPGLVDQTFQSTIEAINWCCEMDNRGGLN